MAEATDVEKINFVINSFDSLMLLNKSANVDSSFDRLQIGYSNGFPFIRINYASKEPRTKENNYNTIYQSFLTVELISILKLFKEKLKDGNDFKIDFENFNKENQLTNILRLCRVNGVPGLYLGNPGNTSKPDIYFKFAMLPSKIVKINGNNVDMALNKCIAWIDKVVSSLEDIDTQYTMENKNKTYVVTSTYNKQQNTVNKNTGNSSDFGDFEPKSGIKSTVTDIDINILDDDIPF